jgi:formylglycine-generating enzyme required for sulfatase activity
VNYILATLTGLCWVSAALLGRAAEPLAEERASDRFPVIESPSVGLPAGKEITLKGMVLNNAHTGQDQKGVFVDVLDGPPEIRAQVEKIMAECYPENGLDADAAMKLQDAWSQRLKYFIASPLAGELHKQATYNARQAMAVTGVVEEKDGQKWIAVSKCEPTAFKYPVRMLAPDRSFTRPDRKPLMLPISGGVALKCIWVPPGRFFMSEPYYQCPHWQEDPQHLVALTKGFYMAEHPITWEIFDAIMGTKHSADKAAKAPANLCCTDMYRFCAMLSAKTGRQVRIPTAAEWEYAARVGTSNPTFRERYADQDSSAGKPMPVKSKRPNAWGFYDMSSSGWERVSDGSSVLDRQDMVDPHHIPAEDNGQADPKRKHGHFGKGNAGYAISEIEYITSEPGPEEAYPGIIRFRIVVEAESKSSRVTTQSPNEAWNSALEEKCSAIRPCPPPALAARAPGCLPDVVQAKTLRIVRNRRPAFRHGLWHQ